MLDPSDLLDGILKDGKENALIKKLAEDIAKNPNKYRTSLEEMKKLYPDLNPSDPALQAKVRQFVQENKELFQGDEKTLRNQLANLEKSPEKMDELRKRLTPPQSDKKNPVAGGGDAGPSGDAGATGREAPQAPDLKKLSKPAPAPENVGDSENPSESAPDRAVEFTQNMVNRLERLIEENIDMAGLVRGIRLSGNGDGNTWLERQIVSTSHAFDSLGKKLKTDRWLGRIGEYMPEGINGPSLGSLRPNLNLGAAGASERPLGEKIFLVFFALFTSVMLLIAMWKVVARYRAQSEEDEERRLRLGPWPVNPGRVSSAQELIMAFEYLSVLKLGFPARAWNHWHIARQFGQPQFTNDEKRQAIDGLARIYEQARYVPETESLSEADLAQANRFLVFLAGASPA